ncbi:hypothetical protein U1Q18_017264 [Sarracenia purpurea var. burkii]
MVAGVGFTEYCLARYRVKLLSYALLGFGSLDLDLVAEFTELGLVDELFTTRRTRRSMRGRAAQLRAVLLRRATHCEVCTALLGVVARFPGILKRGFIDLGPVDF